MGEPKKKICDECKKIIYGLSEKDLDYKMTLHKIKHRRKDGRKEK